MIQKKNGKYYIVSLDKKRLLGGPYEKKEQAVARIEQGMQHMRQTKQQQQQQSEG